MHALWACSYALLDIRSKVMRNGHMYCARHCVQTAVWRSTGRMTATYDVCTTLQSRPGTCNIELDLPEKKLYELNARTQVGLEGAVTAQLTGKLRNLTGNCEHHSLTFGHSKPTLADAETELAYRLRFPRVLGRPVHAQTTIHQQFQNCQADSSYTERQRGASFDLISCAFLSAAPLHSDDPSLGGVVCRILSRHTSVHAPALCTSGRFTQKLSTDELVGAHPLMRTLQIRWYNQGGLRAQLASTTRHFAQARFARRVEGLW